MQGNKNTALKHIVGVGTVKHCAEGVVKLNVGEAFRWLTIAGHELWGGWLLPLLIS